MSDEWKSNDGEVWGETEQQTFLHRVASFQFKTSKQTHSFKRFALFPPSNSTEQIQLDPTSNNPHKHQIRAAEKFLFRRRLSSNHKTQSNENGSVMF
jgi:hypothetical protein